MSDPCFSIFPIDLLQLDLTPQELRVMIALFSFRGRNTNTIWPSLDLLAERAGMPDKKQVSKVTSRLVDKGFLRKRRRGFAGGNVYELTLPDDDDGADLAVRAVSPKVEEFTTLANSSKVEDFTTSKVEEFTTSKVEDSSTLLEVKKEVTKEVNNNNKNNNARSSSPVPVPVSDWQPSELIFTVLKFDHDIPRDFADAQVAEFKIYWRERDPADNWDSRFIDRCVDRWRRRSR
jgi:hypothetical protein